MIRNALWLAGFQVFSKIITFSANNVLIRHVDPAVMGIVHVKMEAMFGLVLFLGREGIREALLRFPVNRNIQEFVDLSWTGIVLVVPIWTLLSMVYWKFIPIEIDARDLVLEYRFLMICYGFSEILECGVETIRVSVRIREFYKTRVFLEGAALLVKQLVILVGVFWNHYLSPCPSVEHDLVAFGLGHLVHGIAIFIFYHGFNLAMAKHRDWPFDSARHTLPSKGLKGNVFLIGKLLRKDTVPDHHSFLELSWLYTIQSVWKYLLNQGDFLLMGLFSSLKSQGYFSIVHNYGSLLVRLVFHPIEESSRQLFSQNPHSPTSLDHLHLVLKFYTYLNLGLVCLGPPAIPQIITMVFGRSMADRDLVAVFSIYCYYLACLSLNGVLEAFTHSHSQGIDFDSTRQAMCVSTIVYMALGTILIPRFSIRGVIVANIVNTLTRFCYNFWWARKLGMDWKALVPYRPVWIVAIVIVMGHQLAGQ